MKKSALFLVILCTVICASYIYATCYNEKAEHYCWSCEKKWGDITIDLVDTKSGHPQTSEACPMCKECSPHTWTYDYDFCEDHD